EFSPDGQLLLVSTAGRTGGHDLSLFETVGWMRIAAVPLNGESRVESSFFSEDGGLLLIRMADKLLAYDIAGKRLLEKPPGVPESCRSAWYNSDRSRAVVLDPHGATLYWDCVA